MTNPWADAASNDRMSESAFSLNPSSSLQRPAISHRLTERLQEEAKEGWSSRALRSSVKALHVLDALVGFLLVVYGLVILASPAKAAIAFTFVIGFGLLIRGSVGLTALHTTMCERYGLVISAYLSPVFGVTLFVLSMLSLGFHGKVFAYLERHERDLHLHSKFLHFWAGHVHFLWVTLLVFSLVEALRFLFVNRLRRRLLFLDDTEELRNHAPRRPPRSSARPWWWRRSSQQDDLRDPLLSTGPHWSSVGGSEFEIHDGVAELHDAERKRQRGWLSRFFGRSDDDELSSVDFASVHEEWASRTEEDPFWWSRDDDDGTQQNEPTPGQQQDKKDNSWVEETTV